MNMRMNVHKAMYNIVVLGIALSIGIANSACATSASGLPPSNDDNATEISTLSTELSRQVRLAVQWRTAVSPPAFWQMNPREYAAPVYVKGTDDVVVATSSGVVARYNAVTGTEIWYRLLPNAVHAQPVVSQGRVYAGTLGGQVYALNLVDGDIDWVANVSGGVETRAATDQGRVFVADTDETLYAFDAISGEELWQYQRPSPEYFTIKGAGTPVVHDGIVYCGFADGILAALFVDNGEPQWLTNLAEGQTELTDVDAPVEVSESAVFAASYAGGVYALDKTDGLVLWHVPMESVTGFMRDGGNIYLIAASGRVQSIDAQSGNVRWTRQLYDMSPVGINISGPFLFLSTASGPLTLVDKSSGQISGVWQPSKGFNSAVTFGNNRGYMLSDAGYLYGFRLAY